MKTVSYKGFQASVEYEDGALFVRVLHIDDVLIAEVDAASEAQGALKELVDAYLEDCKELGKEPQKPFGGSFNVRVDKDLHRRAAMAAADSKVSLNAWVEDAIQQKVACDRFSDRVNGVLKDVQAEVQLLHLSQIARTRHSEYQFEEMSVERVRFHLQSVVRLDEQDDAEEHVWGHH